MYVVVAHGCTDCQSVLVFVIVDRLLFDLVLISSSCLWLY